jgi:hypothetical protein
VVVGGASLLVWMLEDSRPRLRLAAGAALAACLCLNVLATANRVRKNAYRQDYLVAAAFVRQHIDANTKLVIAPYRLGFELGFGPPVINDTRLGFLSKKVPDLFVTTENGTEGDMDGRSAEFQRHLAGLMEHYCLAYQTPSTQVYLRQGSCGVER